MTTPYVDPQSIHNPTAGSAIPATWGDTVRDDLEFLIAPPMVKVYTSAAVNVVNGGAMVTWNTEVWDTDAFHSTSTNTSRITIPTGLGGRYIVQANIVWDTNTAGTYRHLAIMRNTTATVVEVVQPAATYVRQSVSMDIDVSAGDILEVFAGQDSGTTRTVGPGSTVFAARWVSR